MQSGSFIARLVDRSSITNLLTAKEKRVAVGWVFLCVLTAAIAIAAISLALDARAHNRQHVVDILADVGAVCGLLGFCLSLIILAWTVVDTLLARRSLDLLERMIPFQLSHADSFRDHLSEIYQHFCASESDMPNAITLVLSTPAYGIRGNQKDGTPDPKCFEVFLQVMSSWLTHWEEHASSQHPPILRLYLWPKAKHASFFGDVPKEHKDEFLPKLEKMLVRLNKLTLGGKIVVDYNEVDSHEVRFFLLKTSSSFRASIIVMTQLQKELKPAVMRYLHWYSGQAETHDKLHTFAIELREHHSTPGACYPFADLQRFFKEWFNWDMPGAISSHTVSTVDNSRLVISK